MRSEFARVHGASYSVIFVGPSARVEDRPAVNTVEWRPPIRRGDLAHLPTSVRRVGIIDGEFDQSLAVTPREILNLIRRGVEVVGASSMGALRAAELHEAGMRGIGRIFEMYRDEEITADDEVALVFDPESLRPMSEPLVNVRCAVSRLRDAGALSASEGQTIVEVARGLPYPARTYRRILADAGASLGRNLSDIEACLARHDQKRLDALQLFRDVIGADE